MPSKNGYLFLLLFGLPETTTTLNMNPIPCCEICYEKLTSKHDATPIGHFCSETCTQCEQIMTNIMSVQSQYNIPSTAKANETFIYPNAGYTLNALVANQVKHQVEVPKEQYKQILGMLTPDMMSKHFSTFAKPTDVIRAGTFTYFEAKNLAKYSPWAGNIAVYDAKYQIIYLHHIPGFHAGSSIAYCHTIWQGKSKEEALLVAARLESAFSQGSGKLSAMRPAYDYISKKLRANHLYDVLAWNTGSLLLTALFSTNVITSTLSMALWSALDLYWYHKGLQSSEQTGKNIATTGVGVVGGTTGTLIGAAVGSVIFPGVGTGMKKKLVVLSYTILVIGGLLGGFGAGIASTVATKKTLDLFIEDDVVKMQKVFVQVLELVIAEYSMSQQEVRIFLQEEIPKVQLQKELYNMYASHMPQKYAVTFLKPILLQVILSNRKFHMKMKALEFPSEIDIEYAINKYWRDTIVTFELVTELRSKQQQRDRTDIVLVFKK